MTIFNDGLLSFYQLLVWLHVAAGGIALVLFWVPIFYTKGSPRHIQSGRLYANCMLFLSLSGAVSALMVIAAPAYFKAGLFDEGADKAAVAAAIRQFMAFLFYLCILVLTNVVYATVVLKVKANVRQLRQWRYQILPAMLLLSALGVLITGVIHSHIMFMIFSLIGLMSTVDIFRYCWRETASRNDWMRAHIGNICGSGIGVYTAFMAFGGRSLFSDLGQWQWVFWIAPAVVGSVLISRAVKHYCVPAPKNVTNPAQSPAASDQIPV
ncbi:hypothetical protein OCL06_11845 [Alteromonas sp. ASW11-19]|uniref:DUF2306 domain-containing protein n=1 Tax=Alteromonas salexigens TaxID=2982530 RepID=A0ABT2VSR2_9ALTE|nr:hypothetical protein [Alteromonas salexigens]MCU7555281.1 hypothetical protein [Alteromonas salexigens]